MRILLAEDEPRAAQMLARGLREEAYAVDVVADGESAVYQASITDYDAVILDVVLPRKDGLAVCRDIRREGSVVPVLMLTARDAVDARIAGLDSGADDYLTKPFDFGELLARLRALDRRHRETAPPRLVIGDLEIDNERRSVRRGGRDITLTAREFMLLQFLAQNVGRVVTRAELMEHVWDDTQTNYSNIIDVYAARLRRKIDEGERDAMFATVRGVGFRLDVPTPTASKTRRRSTAPRRE